MLWQTKSRTVADQLARQLVNTVLLLCNITESVKIVVVIIIHISMCMAYTINAQIADVDGFLI